MFKNGALSNLFWECRDGSQLEMVQDFKYLESWVDSTENDIKICIGKAKEDLESRPVQIY